MTNKSVKKFETTPLYIVEDHNDVVPFIHRGIGSKHLPLNDIVFVHFDSHPDLGIPCDLKADDVFKKDILYEKMSIENWIIPLVYAGHISHIVWCKPPWCVEIQDKEVQFYVGKCSSSGYIRTTCKENYFVSESLYCSADNLENKKEVRLSVVTILPTDWKNYSSDQTLTTEAELRINCCTKKESSTNTCKHFNDCDQASKRHCSEESRKIGNEDQKIKTSDICCSIISQKLASHLQMLYESFKDKHFILDIDLDFFSTQNPFKVIYTKEIYDFLKELYVFEKPTDLSDDAIHKCNTIRHGQLSELKEIFTKLQQDIDSEFEHPRKDLILKIKAAIKGIEEKPDFLLLHEAGCTFDDTELPEHVSSEGEIIQLVSAVQESLSHFHKPVMITMARSSITDEYCPPYQVEFIQEEALVMLQDLYLEINVTRDYEDSIE